MRYLILVVFCATMVNMASCQSNNTKTQNEAGASGAIMSTIPPDEFDKKLNSLTGVQLVDVRTPGEYEGGHIKNAQNINVHDDAFDKTVATLDKSKPVMVYCKAGSRSAAAAEKLQAMGFKEIYNLDGGIMKWEGAGKPTQAGANVPTKKGMSSADFTKLVTQANFVLVDYNAQWCAPCKKMLPMLEALAAAKKDKLTLLKIDADENKDLLKEKNISSIPYLEMYKDGKLVWSHNGAIDEEALLKETKL